MNIFTIIVTYNGMKWIKRCLDCLRQSSVKTEVLVIDNLSTDGTLQFIQNNYPEVHCFPETQNLGFGQANNVGFRYALEHDADYCLLLNQDAYIQSTAIEEMVNQSDGESLVSPLQLNGDGTMIDQRFHYTLRQAHNSMDDDMLIRLSLKHKYEIVNAAAACWLMPVKLIRKIGGFNPIFFHYGEDFNYLQRIHYQNIKVWLAPYAQMYHDRKLLGNIHVFNHNHLRRDILLIACDINKGIVRILFELGRLLIRQYFYELPKRDYHIGSFSIQCLWLMAHIRSIANSRKKEKKIGLNWL